MYVQVTVQPTDSERQRWDDNIPLLTKTPLDQKSHFVIYNAIHVLHI